MTRNEKDKFLRKTGWTDLWHPDNWIKEDWFDDPKMNVDLAGMSLDDAYKKAIEEIE